MLSDAIRQFRETVQPLFTSLHTGLETALQRLSDNQAALDTLVLRERVALDSIIRRERQALTKEAKEIADTGLKMPSTVSTKCCAPSSSLQCWRSLWCSDYPSTWVTSLGNGRQSRSDTKRSSQ